MTVVSKAASVARSAGSRLADQVFDVRAVAQLTRREHVLCIGDSHVSVFDYVGVPDMWFRTSVVEGATASGIMNPNSATGAFTLFTKRLAVARPWQHIVVCLGEVDCGFVIWHRAQRHGLDIEDQLCATLNSYLTFLRQIKELAFASLSVLSVPLPTITDYPSQWGGEVANLRKEITATQRQRTDLTIRFNRELRQLVASEDIGFIDATSDQLDPNTGLIDQSLVRSQLVDHHLREEPYAALIAKAFGAIDGPGVYPHAVQGWSRG